MKQIFDYKMDIIKEMVSKRAKIPKKVRNLFTDEEMINILYWSAISVIDLTNPIIKKYNKIIKVCRE